MSGKQPSTKLRQAKRKHLEDLLDQALDQSFPASDPPSMATPHRRPKDADD